MPSVAFSLKYSSQSPFDQVMVNWSLLTYPPSALSTPSTHASSISQSPLLSLKCAKLQSYSNEFLKLPQMWHAFLSFLFFFTFAWSPLPSLSLILWLTSFILQALSHLSLLFWLLPWCQSWISCCPFCVLPSIHLISSVGFFTLWY